MFVILIAHFAIAYPKGHHSPQIFSSAMFGTVKCYTVRHIDLMSGVTPSEAWRHL